jgi:signal transduction histidine kinase/ligand-binding sensor domain-containing protein
MSNKLKIFIILQLIFSITVAINVQTNQYRFKHLDKTHGLSSNMIKCIYEDKKGFLWFGTESGLNRFDGYLFKTFTHDKDDTASINDNYILNIFEDHRGMLWIKDVYVYNIYDPVTETFSRNTGEILKDISIPDTAVISDIIKDSKGNYWFLDANGGFYKYLPDKNETIIVKNSSADSTVFSAGIISKMVEDSQNNFWLVYKNGIIEKLDTYKNEIIYRNNFLSHTYNRSDLVFKMCIDTDDDIWLVTINDATGVFYFNTKMHTFSHFDKKSMNVKLNSNIITDIISDDKGLIWIATDHGGINLINKKDFTIQYIMNDIEDDNSLNHNSVMNLYKDNNGIIWAGTYKKGVNYYHPDIFKFRLYKKKLSDPYSLPYNDVNCFVEDENGNIWIGTNGGGLVYFNIINERFSSFTHDPNNPRSISTNTITSLFMDHDKKLWIGTFYGGLNCYDGKRFYRHLPDPLDSTSIASRNVWSIFEDSRKNLWIGTLDQGVQIFNREENKFYTFKDKKGHSIGTNQINTIMEDKEGNLWFGTTSGIYMLDKQSGTFVHYIREDNNPNSLISNGIYKIIEDKRGLIWAATRKGLNLFDKEHKRFRTFTKKDGLPDNLLLTLIEDNNGNLWIGSPNGLLNLVITEYDESDSLSFAFKNYDELDGLQGREFNQFSAYKTKKGELIFGGTEGFNIFTPDKIKLNDRIPNVVLTDFKLYGRSIKVNHRLNNRIILKKSISEVSEIVLKHYEDMFTIEFASLSYFHPEKNKYAYNLEGFSSEWLLVDGKSREATYTNLDPGKYVFRVKGSNNDGIGNEKGTSINIIITPPFWNTVWFRLLAIIFFTALFFAYLRIRTARFRKLNRELEQRVLERTTQLQETNEELESFSYSVSHDLRGPLRGMDGFSQALLEEYYDKLDEKGKDYLRRIRKGSQRMGNLIDDLLKLSRLSRSEMHFVRINLTQLFQSIAQEYQETYPERQVEFIIAGDLFVKGDYPLLKIMLRNLIDNAWKFTSKSLHAKIEFGFISENANNVFFIRDNGIGFNINYSEKLFEVFYRQHKGYEGTGIGLATVKHIIYRHGGKIWAEGKINEGATFYFTFGN